MVIRKKGVVVWVREERGERKGEERMCVCEKRRKCENSLSFTPKHTTSLPSLSLSLFFSLSPHVAIAYLLLVINTRLTILCSSIKKARMIRFCTQPWQRVPPYVRLTVRSRFLELTSSRWVIFLIYVRGKIRHKLHLKAQKKGKTNALDGSATVAALGDGSLLRHVLHHVSAT